MGQTSKTLGEYLNQGRQGRGYTLRALEAICGVPNSTIKRVEDGFIALPHPDVLLALVTALELDILTAVRLVEPYHRLCAEVIHHAAVQGKGKL